MSLRKKLEELVIGTDGAGEGPKNDVNVPGWSSTFVNLDCVQKHVPYNCAGYAGRS